MERKSITKKSLENYESFLRQEEKSQATVEKYLREIDRPSERREIHFDEPYDRAENRYHIE